MSASPLYVRSVGMACPIGLRWTHACAAMRAGIDRMRELPYRNNSGDPIIGSRLSSLDQSFGSQQRWLFLLGHAVLDALSRLEPEEPPQTRMILALTLDASGKAPDADFMLRELRARLAARLDGAHVEVIPGGAAAGFQCLAQARELLATGSVPTCLVAAADSRVDARTLSALNEQRRLLTRDNSDGVRPGEAAACLILQRHGKRALGKISGLGFARERALLSNDTPLRADGVTNAAKAALGEAGLGMHDMDFRISDASGESYAFKEQALVLSRLLRQRKEHFPVWESAVTLGDTGAAAGLCGLISAMAGFQRGYAPGPRAIAFASNDSGERGAVVLEATPMGA